MAYFSQRPHHRVFAAFFLYALILGAIYPRLGDIQLKMGVGESALGLALVGLAVGTQISLAFAQPLINRIGYRISMLVSVPLLGFAEVLATMAPGPWAFFAFLFIAGLGVGVIEMIINLEADRLEHQLGWRIMSRAHAFWSFGFTAAAFLGSYFVWINTDPTMHVLTLFVAVTILNAWIFFDYTPAKARHVEESKTSARFVRPTWPIILLVSFALSAMLLEGASLDWSVIYMRDVHQTAAWMNSATLGIFTLTMAIARYFADGFIDRFGPELVARALIICMAFGSLCIVLAIHPAMAIFGFLLLGIGVSALFPLAISAAAQMTDRPAAVNVAAVVQLLFGMFLLAPPLLGLVAEHFGIRISYAIAIPFVILSWMTTKYVAPKPDTKATPE